ncbi:hypothetical protein [Streptomyces endophyticus]|uniref:Secreted protein n=1 Tax=Streptomyces endophyticus TaxID=714166 RepID=A0ABU6F0D8_9ACTN|nr:hypothetical protein [Streptomyces endophyticus]MEB8337097.1 hypothetical protein [Streptomyces endophyticus]
MDVVLVIMALIFVAFLAFGGYVTVKAVGAAKRGVDRKVEQARRAVEDTTLRAKSYVQPGTAAELAQLRLHLRTSMRATQDALHTRVAEDSSLKESLGLFERLSAHGHEVDAELKRLESEPDKSQVARVLPELRTRTEQITRSADALRHAARDRAGRFASDDLDALSSQIDLEAGALRHWTTEGSGAGSGAGSESGPAWEAPRADRGQGRGREQNRAAITPPGVRPVYPWEKNPRPESTT